MRKTILSKRFCAERTRVKVMKKLTALLLVFTMLLATACKGNSTEKAKSGEEQQTSDNADGNPGGGGGGNSGSGDASQNYEVSDISEIEEVQFNINTVNEDGLHEGASVSEWVTVESGGERYAIAEARLFEWHEALTDYESSNEMGLDVTPEKISGNLTAIPYNDDFKIEFAIPVLNEVKYTLYTNNDGFWSYGLWTNEFVPPTEPGVYIVKIYASWVVSDGNAESGYTYNFFIKFVK